MFLYPVAAVLVALWLKLALLLSVHLAALFLNALA